jgi:methyl-accepting chemotaxis protein
MDTIFKEINTMSSSFAVVNRAVEEQAAGSTQMLTALKTVQDMTGQVQDGTGFIHQRSSNIYQEMEKLQNVSQKVSQKMYEMRLASGSIASFLENAKELVRSELSLKSE